MTEKEALQIKVQELETAILSRLSEASYVDNKERFGLTVEGWEVVKEFPGPAKDAQSGFHAVLFRDEGGSRYVLSFEGTNKGNIRDWENNIGQGADKIAQALRLRAEQYEAAIKLAKTLVRDYPDLHITGHSLGGGLATAAALAIAEAEERAITFNAAGVSDESAKKFGLTLARANYVVTAYRVDGEALSTGQKVGALYFPYYTFGNFPYIFVPNVLVIRVPPNQGKLRPIHPLHPGDDPITLHLMPTILEALRDELRRTEDALRKLD